MGCGMREAGCGMRPGAVIPSERSESRDLYPNSGAPDFIRGGAERCALASHDRRTPRRRGGRRSDPSARPLKNLNSWMARSTAPVPRSRPRGQCSAPQGYLCACAYKIRRSVATRANCRSLDYAVFATLEICTLPTTSSRSSPSRSFAHPRGAPRPTARTRPSRRSNDCRS
jgi:hypothetical protein